MKFNKRCNAGYKNNEYFTNAINKCGWDNIQHIILYKGLTKEEAENKEIELIAKYKSNQREYGYNIANGGHVHCVSNETKEKISKNNARYWKNKQLSEETKNKIRRKRLGQHQSEEAKMKISKNNAHYNLGKHLSSYQKQRISETHKGIKITEKAKQKRKLTYQKRYPNGFHHTLEAIEKMKIIKSIPVICLETNIIYSSAKEAKRQTNINDTTIGLCCKDIRKTAGGFHWKYYKEQS
ncbi:MAG: hypothetical protein IKT40_09975 [Bacilli bacterium]|nr:hypothetical protein [Bacilli bacterium]